jgi:hypothetical protein
MRALSFSLFMALCGAGAAAEPRSLAAIMADEEMPVAEKIEFLKKADPAKDLELALARHDQRFFDLTGYGAVPGVVHWTERLGKKYGTKAIGTGNSMLVDPLDESYSKLRDAYAGRYNKLLFEKLGEKSEPVPDLASLSLDQRIDALIERLALSGEPAAEGPVFSPSKDTHPSDRRVIAYQAADQLEKIGYPAFPKLAAKLDDRRQSAAFGRWKRMDVGMACYSILMWQIYSLPDDVSGSFYRQGADGKMHERPVYFDQIWEQEGLGPWLDARKAKPLADIQLEALSWVLERERAIGAADEEARLDHIAPLERRLEELKKQSEKSGK